ncbi:MAG TPA: hypothetical protein VFH36_05810, partial [Acidimicrobiales bacterium]|nr:hypothetical protein [Acidimicrobiales bacterium]
MQPASTPSDADGGRNPWRRYGPIALVAVVVAALVGASFLGGDDPGDEPEGTTGSTMPTGELPDGVVTWGMAQEGDLEATFPDTCDTSSGMVAIPFFFRAECVAENDTDGGASAPGVTSDTITVVAWLPNDSDPIFGIVRQALGIDDTIDEVRATYEGMIEVFQEYYET